MTGPIVAAEPAQSAGDAPSSETPRTPVTILQIIPSLGGGGAERTVVEMSAAITRAGGRALVFAEHGTLSADVTAAGGEIVAFPAGTKNPLRMWHNASRLARYIKQHNVALVHARSRAPAWSALRAARLARVPFLTTYHGAYGEQNAAKRLYNSVMARGDLVIANSQFTADLVANRYGTPRAKIVVVNRGIDPELFAPDAVSTERRAALRAAWKIAPTQPVILLAGRLTAWKGQLVLLNALGLMKRQGRLGDAVAVLAGDAQGRDGYVADVDRTIQEQGIVTHALRVGHVRDIAAAYAIADVAVVASTKPEAFGRSAAEAMAMGCRVIATRLGAPQETVLAPPLVTADDRTGWLVEPGDAEALANAIAEALALDGSGRTAHTARARRHIVDNFSLASLQRSTLAVYDRLLGTALQPAFDRASEATRQAAETAS